MENAKSWLYTGLFALGCAAVSASLALLGSTPSEGVAQSAAMIDLHILAAFFGGLFLARFTLSSPEAMAGPAIAPVVAIEGAPQSALYDFRESGQKKLSSSIRGAQLVGVLACLMLQFVAVSSPEALAAGYYCPMPHEANTAGHAGKAPLTT